MGSENLLCNHMTLDDCASLNPILRRAEVEGGGVAYTDDKPIHE